MFPPSDMNIFSIAGTVRGFPTRFFLPGSPPPHRPPTPPLSSCSKAQATPNVTDVSLAIVHGWATLNGQLVHRPAPYNGPLFPYNLFSAFAFFMKRNFSLSRSFCPLALLLRAWGLWSGVKWVEVSQERERDEPWLSSKRFKCWTVSADLANKTSTANQYIQAAVNLPFTAQLSLLVCLIGQRGCVMFQREHWGRENQSVCTCVYMRKMQLGEVGL